MDLTGQLGNLGLIESMKRKGSQRDVPSGLPPRAGRRRRSYLRRRLRLVHENYPALHGARRMAANNKCLAERNKSEGRGPATRGMTTILRKYHSVARCTLLGEMIEDTATRYYYRLRSSDELTFVEKSPAIRL